MTNEEIKRSLEKADRAADRIMWEGSVAAAAESGIAGLQNPLYAAQQQQSAGPYCAHLIVGYVRQHLASGRERGWWQCTECDTKFIPTGTASIGGSYGH